MNIPNGWKLVPVEPTEEMLWVAARHYESNEYTGVRSTYKAMLSAAPQPEPVDVEPVAWLSRESESGRICLDVEDSGESGTWSPSFPVYELPPTAEQIEQETAEAIAEMCDLIYGNGSAASQAARDGSWRTCK